MISLFWILVTLTASCNRSPTSALQGQRNTTVTYFGKAVDQDGNPLSGAKFEFRVEAFPKDWTFDTRDKPFEVSKVTAVSDAQGRFQFTITGHLLFRVAAKHEGYRHLYEIDSEDGLQSTYGYSLIDWGQVMLRSNVSYPAIFVFVKDGVSVVSALPCRGGFKQYYNRWVPNEPAWPRIPSLVDVDLKGAQPRVNTELDIHLLVVDENGDPIEGATISLEFRRYVDFGGFPKDFEGGQNDILKLDRTEKVDSDFDNPQNSRDEKKTDRNGRVTIHVNGFQLLSAYAFLPEDQSNSHNQVCEERGVDDTNGYQCNFLNYGQPIWRSTYDRPMTLVLLKQGAMRVKLLPGKGGEEFNGGKWIAVEPFWPGRRDLAELAHPATRSSEFTK